MTGPTPPPEPPPGEGAPAPAEDSPAPAPRWRLRRRGPSTPPEAVTPPPAGAAPDGDGPVEEAPGSPDPESAGRLRRTRKRLLTEREEAVYHLGGLAFELYRRDMLPTGPMRLRAAEVATLDDTVRDIDVRLSAIDAAKRERRRAAPADDAVGCCLTCRTPFRAEARFCWQCGAQVVPPPLGGDDQPTAVISTGDAP